MILYLIRGLPGSGKSTYAKKMLTENPNSVHLEADMFHMKRGKYAWHGSLVSSAHQWCFENTGIFLNNGYDVVVSNTFTQLKEMQRYLDLAKELDCEVRVIRLNANYGSVHNVPPDVIVKMRDRFEM